MAVRRESVVLDLDDRLTPGLLRAAGAAGVLNHELGRLDGQSVGASRSMSGLERDTDNLGRRFEQSGASINRYSGRLGLIIDAAVVLGPALITLGAEGIPAITGLASGFGFLAVGAGTTALAFHGVGDALTKFNKASLEPTATNIHNAQIAMDKLPASAQQFVVQLHQMGPELHQLQAAAGSGLFAGLSDGLVSVQRDFPIVRAGLRSVSAELGEIARASGKSFASDRWQPFLRFIGAEAPHALSDMSTATGSAAHGLAELWMAFAPINGEFDAGVVRLANDFDQWATSLGKTKGFEDFIQYLEANGPRVLDTLGSLGMLLVDIGRQAAPLGGPMLDALRAVFNILDAIVNSDIGTPLLAGIIAFRLYARAMQVMGVQVETSWRGIAAMPAEVSGQISRASAATTAYARTTIADLDMVSRAWMRSEATSGTYAGRLGDARARLLGQGRQALKGAGTAAAIGFVASGASDSMGLTNTTALALAGSLGGPLTAALGGAAGALLDMKSASDQARSGQEALDHVLKSNTSTLADYQNAAQVAHSEATKLIGDFKDAGTAGGLLKNSLAHPGEALSLLGHGLTGDNQFSDVAASSRAAIAAQAQARDALNALAAGEGAGHDASGRDMVLTTQQLEQAASAAQPAMDALHISLVDLQQAAAANDGSLQHMVGSIVDWMNNADSAQGRSEAVKAAFAQMGDASLTAADRVAALNTALDQLIDPMLNLGQARDAFQKGLNDLPAALSKTSKGLRGTSDAAIQNRGAVRSLVGQLKTYVEQQAAAGVPAKRMIATLMAGRQALIEQGRAAGLNKQQLKDLIAEMHLTPKDIKTTVSVDVAKAKANVDAIKAAIAAIDRTVNVAVDVTRHVSSAIAGITGGKPQADGGTVEGQRHPYGDKVLSLLAPGEEIISNRNGQADRFRADRAAGRIPGYAMGGTVAGGGNTAGRTRADRVQHSLDKATNSLDKMTSKLDSLNQAEKQYATQISQSLRSDLFGQSNVWGAGSDPQSILRGDIRNARTFNQALHRLRRKGVHGGAFQAIAASGDVDAATMLAGENRSDLRQYQHLFQLRSRLTNQAGAYAAGQRFDRAEAHAAHQRDRLHKEVVHLRHEVAHLRKEAKHHADKVAHAASTAGNSSARHAARRKTT